jgi:hypothetical protein
MFAETNQSGMGNPEVPDELVNRLEKADVRVQDTQSRAIVSAVTEDVRGLDEPGAEQSARVLEHLFGLKNPEGGVESDNSDLIDPDSG